MSHIIMNEAITRAPFSRQPARILLIDYSPPFSKSVCNSIVQSLEDLFGLVCHLSGPCRIPYFGLFALGSYSENVFPLQHVKGNLSRLKNALGEMITYQQDGCTVGDGFRCLFQAMSEAISQFKRQSQTLRQTTGFSVQLELILMTCQPAITVSKELDNITTDLDLETLRKIQVVSLSQRDVTCEPVLGVEGPNSSQMSSTTSSDGALGGTGAVETMTMEADALSLQNYFYGWLHDQGTDREHMHLSFSSKGHTEGLLLKCDLQERLVNPAMLTAFQDSFTLNIHSLASKKTITPSSAAMKTHGMPTTVPVIHLQAVKLIKISGICDSVVFGIPIIVQSSACWKLDWEELELNQCHFNSLCQLLHEKDLALLVQETSAPPLSSYHNTFLSASKQPPLSPLAHYVLFPSSGGTLLLKSVASREMLLPSNGHHRVEKPVFDALIHVESHLHKLEILDTYNSLMVRSGLNESLSRLTSKGAPKRCMKRFLSGASNASTSASTRRGCGRGQSSRGRGSALSTSSKRFRPPVLADVQDSFPDYEE